MRTQIRLTSNDTNNVTMEFDAYPEVANVSQSVNLNTNISRGTRGFQFSENENEVVCTLDGSYRLYSDQGYKGILTKALSNADGYFTSLILISVDARNIQDAKIYIIFDKVCNEYATEFKVAVNSTVLDTFTNSNVCAVVDLSAYDFGDASLNFLDIIITRWSKPFASAKITSLTSAYKSIFTGNEIKNFECSENALNTFTSIQPGIVAQYADVVLYDRYNSIKQLAEKGILPKTADIEIIVIRDSENSEVLGNYVVSDWNVAATNSEVSITSTDSSVKFKDIFVENIPAKQRNVDDMLNLLFSYVKDVIWRYDDADTETYCKSIVVPDNWFKGDNLDRQLHKVCTLGMLRIYWSINTFVVMRCY